MTTINDVAKVCGVSKATVSRVINNKADGVGKETRLRIQQIIAEMGYRPNALAQGIATSKTKTIGVILPNITTPCVPKSVCGINN
jgi:LacI family transcriptional regulator